MRASFDTDVRASIESLWSVTLGLPAQRAVGVDSAAARTHLLRCITGSGAWEGIVTVSVSENLARRVAGSIFESPGENVTIDKLHDALGEIANRTGGGVKGLLPGPSLRSLPSVVSGAIVY
jgi:chemotaxis protein CheX